ncbi:hypothetical protein [Streptomyces sp. bgisy153]|uniref:hypothetical protein n=1 Tax=Streptomyces sp. bgisy153 TaxID=3413793 RepID=UPI003D751DED
MTGTPSPYAEPEMYSSAAGLRRSRDGLNPQPGDPDVLGRCTAEVPVTDLPALLAALLHAQALLRGSRPASTQPVEVSLSDGMVRLDRLAFAVRREDELEIGVGFRELPGVIAELEALLP